MWDDGDGLRFGNETHTVYFTKAGLYPIKLVTINQFQCTDTVVTNVTISGINAGIKSITKKLLCDDIIQFRDSSGIFGPRHSDTIVKYTWDFGEGKAVSHLMNPFYYYRSQGEKIVTLKVESSKGCVDTTSIRINIPGPIPFFSLIDTLGCVPFTIEVKNLSKNARDYICFMGDPSQSIISTQSDTSFKFTYTTPGTYHVQLFASDSVENPDNKNELYYCGYYFPDKGIPSHPERKVIVLPKPNVDFSFNEMACYSKELKLYGPNADDGYVYTWKLNGQVFSQEKPNTKVRFNHSGQQTISLNISNKINGKDVHCSADTSKHINVFGQKVNLDIQKNQDCISYSFKANENSSSEYNWSIEFNDREYTAPSNNEVNSNFKSYTGPAKICVSIKGKEGCVDSACQKIDVDSMNFRMTPFNVFTPGTDGKNDIFFIQIENYSLYELNIYNRWGERVFSSNNPNYGWDGNEISSGRPMPDGTYFYFLETAGICSPDNQKKRMSGTLTLIREKQ